MNFVLIPFFLGVHLLSQDNDDLWKYGPEYTFDTRVGMISALKADNGRHLGTSLSLKLICRPDEPDNLICRFKDAKVTKLSPRSFDVEATIPDKSATYRTYGIGNFSLQVKFQENGIEFYKVSSADRIPQSLLNDYRSIINQLSIGANLIDNESKFKLNENFTVGMCPTSYTIFTDKTKILLNNISNYELESMVHAKLVEDETIIMDKLRDIDNCLIKSPYSFGIRYLNGIVLRDVVDKLKSSKSTVAMSRVHFHSETINTVDIYDEKGNNLGSMLDHIYVTLESVKPARSKLNSLIKEAKVYTLMME